VTKSRQHSSRHAWHGATAGCSRSCRCSACMLPAPQPPGVLCGRLPALKLRADKERTVSIGPGEPYRFEAKQSAFSEIPVDDSPLSKVLHLCIPPVSPPHTSVYCNAVSPGRCFLVPGLILLLKDSTRGRARHEGRCRVRVMDGNKKATEQRS
jgi:hypothetical protein